MKICRQGLASSTKLQKRSFHLVDRTRTAAKCSNMKNARACMQTMPFNRQFCDVSSSHPLRCDCLLFLLFRQTTKNFAGLKQIEKLVLEEKMENIVKRLAPLTKLPKKLHADITTSPSLSFFFQAFKSKI